MTHMLALGAGLAAGFYFGRRIMSAADVRELNATELETASLASAPSDASFFDRVVGLVGGDVAPAKVAASAPAKGACCGGCA